MYRLYMTQHIGKESTRDTNTNHKHIAYNMYNQKVPIDAREELRLVLHAKATINGRQKHPMKGMGILYEEAPQLSRL